MRITTLTIADFQQLLQHSDVEVVRRFILVVRNSRKGLVPKSVAAIGEQVRRDPQFLALALFDAKGAQVAEFRFAPIPSFHDLRC